MRKPSIRLLVASDIHLGHRRNSASEIIANLRSAVGDNPQTAQLDILFIAGDLFDTLLHLPADSISEIDQWIKYLLTLCAKHNILLRILEGTPSHDWKQSQRFVDINELWQLKAPVKYFDTLAIEYIAEIDRHVLYVPDQYSASTEKTLEEVRALMKARSLTQVDIAIMHGQFDYQVGSLPVPKHDSKAYLELVRELISIGHDHHFTMKDRIVAQGSFDRLAHGEEEPKGHITAYLPGDGTVEVTFVENVNAKKFVTVDCRGLDTEHALGKVNALTAGLPPGSQVRTLFDPGHPLIQQPGLFVRTWPLLVWSKPKVERSTTAPALLQDLTNLAAPEAMAITRDNIVKLLMERMSHMTRDPRVLEQAQLLLEEVK